MPSVLIQFPPSAARVYEVAIGTGLLAELGWRVARAAGGRRAFLISDQALPPAIITAATDSLGAAGFAITSTSIAASESAKSLETAASLLTQLAATKHERTDPVIALGGGVVTDIAGFVAATYRRGVPVIQCPTTLLGMVDAAVGGKTGVNLLLSSGDLKKNLVGAFWQPMLVVADIDTLRTLPPRHLRAGLAECIKHGLISHATDPALFEWIAQNTPHLLAGDPAALAELITRNVRVKASFVIEDEREEKPSSAGGRALLNLGHTFAHAIETIPGLSPDGNPASAPLTHGEAVALGLIAAAATSHALGRLGADDADAILATVERAELPTKLAGLPPDAVILASMSHDKKISGGRLRLILPVRIGESVILEDPPRDAVLAGIRSIRA